MSKKDASPIQTLSDRHWKELHLGSGLSADTIKARGYFTAESDDTLSEAVEEGKATRNQLLAGLVIPIFHIGRKKSKAISYYQVKPDEPRRRDGKEIKYESFAGKPQLIDNGWYKLPRDVDIIFTEGIKKADALRQVFPDSLVVALASTSGGMTPQKKSVIRTDLYNLLSEYQGGKIYFCFDSDMATNPSVWQGVDRYKALLENNGFEPIVVSLPHVGDEKVGADDLLVRFGPRAVEDAFFVATKEMPPKPSKAGERDRRSADKETADRQWELFQSELAIDEQSLSDAYVVDIWLNGFEDKPSVARRTTMYFDAQTKAPYLYQKADRVFLRADSKDGIRRINQWFMWLVDSGHILKIPDPARFGKSAEGERRYGQAMRARLKTTAAVCSAGKAASVFGLLTGEVSVQTDEFNHPDYDHLFPLVGGQCIDLSNPDLPLVETPIEAKFTWCSPVTPDEYLEAKHSGEEPLRFNAFLDDLDDGRGEAQIALRALLGYAMQGHRRHWGSILHGEGRNGKSELLKMFSKMLGAGYKAVKAKAFIGRDQRHDQHWLEHKHRRAILATDPAGTVRDDDILPYIAGDEIAGEVKGGQNVTFRPRGMLFIPGQADRIRFSLADDALRDRLLSVTFTRQFFGDAQDTQLEADLELELPLILFQLAQHAHEYIKTKTLAGFEFMKACTEEVMGLGNSVKMFMDGQIIYCVTGREQDVEVSVANFIAHYKRFCEQHGVKPIDNRNGSVTKALRALSGGRVRSAKLVIDETGDAKNRRLMLQGIVFTDDAGSYDQDMEGHIEPKFGPGSNYNPD